MGRGGRAARPAERLHRRFFCLAVATPAAWEPPVDVFQDERELVVVVTMPSPGRRARATGNGWFHAAADRLDCYQEVSDGFGHEAGDARLVATAERLQQAVRESGPAAQGDTPDVLYGGQRRAGCWASLSPGHVWPRWR